MKDGNGIAGELSDVFAADVTVAIATCGGCGASRALAQARVYEGPGLVVRCPACDGLLLRLARIRGETRVEMRGIRVLRLP